MTYSLPVIDAARSEATKATSSAPGRPSGMPPSDFINSSRAVCVSVPELAANRSISAVAALVCMKPARSPPIIQRSKESSLKPITDTGSDEMDHGDDTPSVGKLTVTLPGLVQFTREGSNRFLCKPTDILLQWRDTSSGRR
jgi:hypothetical protein